MKSDVCDCGYAVYATKGLAIASRVMVTVLFTVYSRISRTFLTFGCLVMEEDESIFFSLILPDSKLVVFVVLSDGKFSLFVNLEKASEAALGESLEGFR